MVWPISDDHTLSHTCGPCFHPIAGPVTSLIMALFLCINIALVRFYVLTVVTINITAFGVNITSMKMDTFWIFMFVFSTSDPMFPAVMAQYGPWEYLILGMLICGVILVLCGLWECCCQSSKRQLPAGGPASTSAATTVFIISSARRMGHHRRNSTLHQEEAPSTPGPPLYEELDQPPPYSSLFPVTKASNMEPLTLQENHTISSQHM